MTSPSTSGRHQIAYTCLFWATFVSRFLDNGSTDFNQVYSFGQCDSSVSLFVFLLAIRHVCFLTPKTGLERTGFFRISVAFKSDIRVDAWVFINVFGTSDSKYYTGQTLRGSGIGIVSHCSNIWQAFLLP